MKIALPTDDSKTISAHFGRAPYFIVADISDDGKISYEQRQKAFHGSQEEHDQHHHDEQGQGGMHQSMFGVISDCKILIAGGMGQPAYEHARSAGLDVIFTGEKDIETAVKAYLQGALESDARRVHIHR
jgi:predicted Fe-Mo cluster-binding NifX family protein